MQRLLSGPWVPGGGVSGQALAVAPDGKLLFSGGHWDGSLRVTALPRGRLLSQLRCHLGTRRLGAWGVRGGTGLRAGQGGITVLFPLFPPPLPLPRPVSSLSSSPPCRCSNLPCAGHLWHLPHLRLPRHHMHGVAAHAAGVLGGSPVGPPWSRSAAHLPLSRPAVLPCSLPLPTATMSKSGTPAV